MSRRVIVDLTDEQAAKYEDWTECAAFRIHQFDDGTARLEVSNDLELITRPEEVDRRERCSHCKGTGRYTGQGFEARCRYCAGTGRR
jgi:hypothetical protein